MNLMDVAEHKKTGREWFQEGVDNYKRNHLGSLKKTLGFCKMMLSENIDDVSNKKYQNGINDIKKILKEDYGIETI